MDEWGRNSNYQKLCTLLRPPSYRSQISSGMMAVCCMKRQLITFLCLSRLLHVAPLCNALEKHRGFHCLYSSQQQLAQSLFPETFHFLLCHPPR
jgi:hypothetical protein